MALLPRASGSPARHPSQQAENSFLLRRAESPDGMVEAVESTRLGFELFREEFAKLHHFGPHDRRAIALEGIPREIFLMVRFRLKPRSSRYHFSHDGIRIEFFLVECRDNILGHLFLVGVVIKNRGSILSPNIVALSIQCRRIMDDKEHLEEFSITRESRIKGNPNRLRMTSPASADCVIGWSIDMPTDVAGL